MSSNIVGELHLTGGNLISLKCLKCAHMGVCSHKEEMLTLVNRVNEMEVLGKKDSIFKLDINCQYFMEYPKSNPWGDIIPCSNPSDGYTPRNPFYDNRQITVTTGKGTGPGDYLQLSGSSVCGGLNHGNITTVNSFTHSSPNLDIQGTSTTDIKQSEPVAKSSCVGIDNIQFYQ